MLKRDHRDENHEQPTTPTAESKRPRESGSLQDLRTPLKTSSGSMLPGSASFDFISPRRPGEEDEERRRNRAGLVKKQQESREALRSPAAGASPRAEPLSSSLKRSTSGSSVESGGHGANLGSSPSLLSAQTAQETRSILTASKSRLSLSTTRLNSIQPPTAEQMTKSFDEWMKMAADNKINSKNSWSFALIDYFSELTFLRDGDSINFQKASCTLDGCVKIYASRVDSVVNETTKLLNGLSDKSNKFRSEDSDSDDDDANGGSLGNSANISKTSKAKKSSLRTVETIEKNPENLILKNFDLEFAIDPLFKKTSAEFDESGTKGALLKNLECSPIDNLIIFDSSDQIQMDFSIPPDFVEQNNDETVDISLLSSMFGSAIIDLDRKYLCPTFDDYNFNQSLADIRGTLEKLSRITAELPEREQTVPSYADVDEEEEEDEEDTRTNHFHDDFDLIMPNDDGGDYYEDEIEENSSTEKSVKWANNNDASDETGLSYFDGAFKQTWAGPEHWKIRKSQRITSHGSNSNNSNNPINLSTGKIRRNSKVEKVAIDFMNSSIDFRQIFSKPTSNNQISLSKASIIERKENDHLLPDDLHFSSGSLLKLFIKPTWKMTKTTNKPPVRATRSSSKSSEMMNEGNFVERNFWIAQESHENGIFQEKEAEATEAEPETRGAYADDDDGLYDDYYEDVGPIEHIPEISTGTATVNGSEVAALIEAGGPIDFNTNLVAAPKFTYTPQLNYARVAKRVDVAKLKATLWSEFLTDAKKAKAADDNKKPPGSQSHPQNGSFAGLMNSLSKTYPSEALAEVSVPYCFICLLHLANENNLEIKAEGADLIIRN